MTRSPNNSFKSAAGVLAAFFLFSTPSSTQTRAPAGNAKSDAPTVGVVSSVPAPRTAEGYPDLSGLYFSGPKDPDEGYDLREVNGANKKAMGPADKPSYQPWALEKIKRIGNLELASPNIQGQCPPHGVAGVFFKGSNFAIQFVQTPKQVIILSEQNVSFRIIHTDGRQHPKPEDVYPQFMGNSIGHWEGDTLVVDTLGADTNTWVGAGPLFASDVAHYVETFRHPDDRALFYQFTIDDPKVLTKPWTSPMLRYTRSLTRDIEEYYCTNNQDQKLGLVSKYAVPLTANGTDERYFDEQEYEELNKKYNNK